MIKRIMHTWREYWTYLFMTPSQAADYATACRRLRADAQSAVAQVPTPAQSIRDIESRERARLALRSNN